MSIGIVMSPATAHAQMSGIGHSSEVLNFQESAFASADDAAQKAPDLPGQPVSHHHCTIALEVMAPALVAAPEIRDGLLRPAISRTLVSYPEAPPTEPPAS